MLNGRTNYEENDEYRRKAITAVDHLMVHLNGLFQSGFEEGLKAFLENESLTSR